MDPQLIPALLLDAVLAITLVAIATRLLAIDDLFQSVVLFIVFGVLMAVAWARLHAVDLALAEAAIGAGLTGALFLHAIGGLARQPVADKAHSRAGWAAAVVALPAGVLGIVLVRAVFGLPDAFEGLAPLVEAEIDASGASNPVTAVLLNFRAYDTLLEVAVLLLATMGVWSLAPQRSSGQDDTAAAAPGRVLTALLRLVVPVIIVTAGYLLWVGTSAPGGAFQAAAVLCAAGVLVLVSNVAAPPTLRTWPARALIGAGLVVFLGVSVAVQGSGRTVLTYPPGWAGTLILLVEAVLTISIAAMLAALFAGGEQESGEQESGEP